MCGIVGYLGKAEAPKVLINGLRRLEYRGYDSAGLAVMDGDRIAVAKAPGKVAALNPKSEVELRLS
jgi:glucosamine--fructose-6-phosphate aminotransferase (isomerizing)